MGIRVINPGLQTTVQGRPRIGLRHKGVPSGGAADALSLALANRLLDNPLDAPALEVTLSSARFVFEADTDIAITGGTAKIFRNGHDFSAHRTYHMRTGDSLDISSLTKGCRVYLAVRNGTKSSMWLDSPSTYLPAALGGHEGRVLRQDDLILLDIPPHSDTQTPVQSTPTHLRPHIGQSWMLRATLGPDTQLLSRLSQATLFEKPFTVSHRASRMGAELEGQVLKLNSDGRLPSAAVFPGTLQCPPSGKPFLLMADAGTTGGYPRIAQIIRADRHMLGQVRPGDRIQLRRTSAQEAAIILANKTKLLRTWLGDTFELG
jgi:biotin-dependent carboxylase-like uncharacterized protein